MACENCLHYFVCPDSKNRIISGCPFFSDKSEWVHLPCKVGDYIKWNNGLCYVLKKVKGFEQYNGLRYILEDCEPLVSCPEIVAVIPAEASKENVEE